MIVFKFRYLSLPYPGTRAGAALPAPPDGPAARACFFAAPAPPRFWRKTVKTRPMVHGRPTRYM